MKFHNYLYNFGRDPSYEYAWTFRSKSVAYFQTRCRVKFFLPYGPMLTKTNNNCQNLPKFVKISKIWNFANLYTTLVETLPGSMNEFLGVNLLCIFRGDFVEKQQTLPGDMAKRYFPPHLALICLTGPEKRGFKDDIRTTDACVTTVALLCRRTNQS